MTRGLTLALACLLTTSAFAAKYEKITKAKDLTDAKVRAVTQDWLKIATPQGDGDANTKARAFKITERKKDETWETVVKQLNHVIAAKKLKKYDLSEVDASAKTVQKAVDTVFSRMGLVTGGKEFPNLVLAAMKSSKDNTLFYSDMEDKDELSGYSLALIDAKNDEVVVMYDGDLW